MLKGIDPVVSPELLKVLCEMGHGSEMLFADGNFPSHDYNVKKIIRLDGIDIPTVLKAIMPLFPLDTFVESPVVLMQPNADFGREPDVWAKYKDIIAKHQKVNYEYLERFAYYDRCKNVYAIVATSELEIYANIILKKGVIFPDKK
ncbi:RbsD/FucU family protein [Brachyspira innocens]|uniref:RbsD/FucU family protein n=1 Tax=Brachyspira innocens TaxID=13264 RepID=UPI0026EE713C|nr:RbsD/FucU domain-containing protein [Brachyspira innocens]